MVAFTSIISTVSVFAVMVSAQAVVDPATAAAAYVKIAETLATADSNVASGIAPLTPVAKRQTVNFGNPAITTTVNTLNGNSIESITPGLAKRQASDAAIAQEGAALLLAAAQVQAAQAQAAL